MANPLLEDVLSGTFGELLVQMRLLQYGVQSTVPSKDSGNDIVTFYGRVAKFVQVKTCSTSPPITVNAKELRARIWDILAIVLLTDYDVIGRDNISVNLEKSRIFFVKQQDFDKGYFNEKTLAKWELSKERVVECFCK